MGRKIIPALSGAACLLAVGLLAITALVRRGPAPPSPESAAKGLSAAAGGPGISRTGSAPTSVPEDLPPRLLGLIHKSEWTDKERDEVMDFTRGDSAAADAAGRESSRRAREELREIHREIREELANREKPVPIDYARALALSRTLLEDSFKRLSAAYELSGHILPAEILESLVSEWSGSRKPAIRGAIVKAISGTPDPRLRRMMLESLRSGNPEEFSPVLRILGPSGHPEDISPVLRILWPTGRAAYYELDDEMIEAVGALRSQAPTYPEKYSGLYTTLGRQASSGNAKCLDLLMRDALEGQAEYTRINGLESLPQEHKRIPLLALRDHPSPEIQRAVLSQSADYLRHHPDKDVLSILTSFLSPRHSERVQLEVLISLGRVATGLIRRDPAFGIQLEEAVRGFMARSPSDPHLVRRAHEILSLPDKYK